MWVGGFNAGRIFTKFDWQTFLRDVGSDIAPKLSKKRIDTISTKWEFGSSEVSDLISPQFSRTPPPTSLNRLYCHGSSSGMEGSVKGAHTEEPPDPRRSQINTEIPALGNLVLFGNQTEAYLDWK